MVDTIKIIPRIDDSNAYHFYCAKCFRLFIAEDIGCNYCPSCGQKLKWKEKYSKNWNLFNKKYYQDFIKKEIRYYDINS